jgi:hypothetical protein
MVPDLDAIDISPDAGANFANATFRPRAVEANIVPEVLDG